MSENVWTVKPEVERRDLGEYKGKPFWVEFKKRLTIGEKKRIEMAGFRSLSRATAADEDEDRKTEINVDWEFQAFVRVRTWLVDWSLADENNNKLKVSDVLQHLDEDVFDKIEEALNAHVEAIDALKKTMAGAR